MFKNFDAVIFDMDGTLIDSMWVWAQVDRDFLGERGLEVPDDLGKEIEGLSFEQTADYFLNRFDLGLTRDNLMQIWVDMCHEAYRSKVGFKPGALEFLKYLKNKNVKIGIATSNARELVELVGNALGFLPYIDVIATSEDVPNGKPAPDIYLLVAKTLGVAPKHCLVFEDIMQGIHAGKAAGMHVCAVKDEFSINQEEEKYSSADWFINSFTELL